MCASDILFSKWLLCIVQTQVAQLDKGIKDATAQKELLECEAQKVKQDLLDMVRNKMPFVFKLFLLIFLLS